MSVTLAQVHNAALKALCTLNARFSDLIVPVADIAQAGADPARLAAVEIRLDAPAGTLYLDDLRFE